MPEVWKARKHVREAGGRHEVAQVDGDALMAHRETPESSEVHLNLPERVMTLEEALFANQIGSAEQGRKGLSRFAAKMKNFRETQANPSLLPEAFPNLDI